MEHADAVPLTARLRASCGIALLWLGNWLFVRWAAWLLHIEAPTTTGSIYLALVRNELINEHGVEGLALIKGFHDAYLTEE